MSKGVLYMAVPYITMYVVDSIILLSILKSIKEAELLSCSLLFVSYAKICDFLQMEATDTEHILGEKVQIYCYYVSIVYCCYFSLQPSVSSLRSKSVLITNHKTL